ncbi:hypothetical protein ACS0TY_012696 [Phlomoides rotata]
MAEEEPPLFNRFCERLIPEITSKLPSLIASAMANLGPDLGFSFPPPNPTPLVVTIPTPANLKPAFSSTGLHSFFPPLGNGMSPCTILGNAQGNQAPPEATLDCATSPVPAIAHAQHVKSYAHAISAVKASPTPISIDILEAMKPVRKGLYLTVAVDEGLHKQGVLELRDSLIGRVSHVRGDKPLVQAKLIKKLTTIWGVRSPWSLIPIGEGYYNFQFTCGDDRERIFDKRTWQIKPGLLRLQPWVQDFNPYKVSTSVAQVWIRISELPLEYWNNTIITALASAVGTVIKLDERTASRSIGRFARVLVELDLKQDREEYVIFERADHRYVVYIQYERLPEFCNYCNVMGHSTGNCGTYHNPNQGKKKSAPSDPKVGSKTDPPTGGTKQWIQHNFGGFKPPDITDAPAAPHVLGSGPSQLYMGAAFAAPTVPCFNKFGALTEEVLVAGASDLAGNFISADASGLEATNCDTENLVSLRGLEVHLPPIVNTSGGSPTTNSSEQAMILSPATEPDHESKDSSMDGFERVSGQRGKRGRGRPPIIPKDHNLRNRTHISEPRVETDAHAPGPGLVIPEANSTRPLQVMRNVANENWDNCVNDLPPTHGFSEGYP